MSEPSDLITDLQELRRACEAADWEAAARLMQIHDGRVRAEHTIRTKEELTEVLEAQRTLLTEMTTWRDEAERRLGEIQRSSTAAHAYSDGASES